MKPRIAIIPIKKHIEVGPTLSYPFIQERNPPKGADLLLLVNGSVPRGLPEQLRGDVCQEIILAVLSGELTEAEIPANVHKFIRLTRRSTEGHYMAVSLDAPRYDGSSWHDFLPDPSTI